MLRGAPLGYEGLSCLSLQVPATESIDVHFIFLFPETLYPATSIAFRDKIFGESPTELSIDLFPAN
jgi:hypothetical protein